MHLSCVQFNYTQYCHPVNPFFIKEFDLIFIIIRQLQQYLYQF